MALMTGPACPRVVTLTDHEEAEEVEEGCRDEEVTMISLLGSLVGLINRR